MLYGMIRVFSFMTLPFVTNEDQFCSNGLHAEENCSLLPKQPNTIPPPRPIAQQQHHATLQRSTTEEELRKAAGGKCYDTFLHAVQGWTNVDIDAISTVTQKSPIHMAAWKGNINNLIYFIDTLGCNMNRISQMKYSYGKTCLFFALTQSRCDVVEYLLERGAHVKIINNKGQSPLSIASSHFNNNNDHDDHDDRSIIRKIIQAEQHQSHLAWVNYRSTHSDHCIYGDLDPRFLHLERPIDVDTDVITPYAINPTTKAIRRSGLYRKLNNFTFDQKQDQEQQQSSSLSSPTTTKRKRNTPKRDFSPEDRFVLDAAWNDVNVCVKNEMSSDALMSHIWTIVQLHSKLQKAWIPEVVEKLQQINVRNDDVIPSMFKMLLSESSKVILSKQDRTLIRKVYDYYIDPSCYRQQSEVDRVIQATSSTQQQQQKERDSRLDNRACHDAYNIVKDLYLRRLIAESVTKSNDDPIHNPESKSSVYLSLPYTPVWVDTIEQLSNVRDTIKHVPLVAIDAEWHDNDSNNDDDNNKNSMLSTLQIAIVHNTATIDNNLDTHNYDTNVWVIDLLTDDATYRNMSESLIREMLSTKIVLGFSISNDMKRLRHYCNRHNKEDPGQSSLSVSTKYVLDIQLLWQHSCSPAQMLGLARCVQDVIVTTTTPQKNVLLSKEYQCSDWSQRPLSQLQLQYAGLDAVIVLYLFSEQHRRMHLTQREVG